MKSFKEYRISKLPQNLNEIMLHGYSDDDHSKIHSVNRFESTDPEHIKSIYRHSESSSEVNSFLHSRYNGEKNIDDSLKNKANRLTDALNTAKIKEAVHVYTGIKHSPVKLFEKDTDLKPKDVHLPAFTSTSTSRPVALNFARGNVDYDGQRHGIEDDSFNRHILKIHLPEGTSAASIMEHAMMPREKEILLNRGHNISIDPIPEKITDNTYQWNARITSHTPTEL